MKLQIIEGINKHAVTLVLVVGILMLTDKGIMPTGMVAMLLFAGRIVGFLFRVPLLIVRVVFILFTVGFLFSQSIKPTDIKVSTCTSSAPVMPAVWSWGEHIRPAKGRLPNAADEPKSIGCYLGSLRDIPSNPGRENVLKEFSKEAYIRPQNFPIMFFQSTYQMVTTGMDLNIDIRRVDNNLNVVIVPKRDSLKESTR